MTGRGVPLPYIPWGCILLVYTPSRERGRLVERLPAPEQTVDCLRELVSLGSVDALQRMRHSDELAEERAVPQTRTDECSARPSGTPRPGTETESQRYRPGGRDLNHLAGLTGKKKLKWRDRFEINDSSVDRLARKFVGRRLTALSEIDGTSAAAQRQ